MIEYIVKLVLLVPFVAGLAWACLWLWKRAQAGLLAMPGSDERALRVVEIASLGPQTRLALVECDGRRVLIGQSRAGLVALSE
ncbi:MAG: flagellar biosynthetic protein FliO, partial [Sphingomonas sp.]